MAESLPHPKSYYFASANHQTDYPVLQGEEKQSRLALCDLAGKVLKEGMGALGIEVTEKM